MLYVFNPTYFYLTNGVLSLYPHGCTRVSDILWELNHNDYVFQGIAFEFLEKDMGEKMLRWQASHETALIFDLRERLKSTEEVVDELKEIVVDISGNVSVVPKQPLALNIISASPCTVNVADADKINRIVTVINPSARLSHTLNINNISGINTSVISPNAYFRLAWDGATWHNADAPSTGSSYIQFQGMPAPVLLYPCTYWSLLDLDGAFFRAESDNIPFADTLAVSAVTDGGASLVLAQRKELAPGTILYASEIYEARRVKGVSGTSVALERPFSRTNIGFVYVGQTDATDVNGLELPEVSGETGETQPAFTGTAGTTGNTQPAFTGTAGTTGNTQPAFTGTAGTTGNTQPQFTGTKGTVSVSGGNHRHRLSQDKTAASGNNARRGTVSTTGADNNPYTTYSGNLSMSGSFTPAGTVANHNHSFTPAGTVANHNHSFTPAGTVESHAHSYTPAGTVESHSHSFNWTGSLSSTDKETRPANMTVRVWVRRA